MTVCFVRQNVGMIGRNVMTDEDVTEYLGDGYSIVGHTVSRCFGPEWREERDDCKGIILPRGLYCKNGRLEWIMRLITQGHGTREIIRTANVTGRTVRKYRDILQKLELI